MDLGGIVSKLSNPKVGMALGVLATEAAYAKGTGQNLISVIEGQVNAAIQNPHFPSFTGVIEELTQWTAGQVFKPAIAAAVIGYVGEEMNLSPGITKIARLAKNLGSNAAWGAVLAAVAWRSTVANSPPDMKYFNNSGSGGSGSGAVGGYSY